MSMQNENTKVLCKKKHYLNHENKVNETKYHHIVRR